MTVGLLSVTLVSCGKDDPATEFKIEGLTLEHFPRLDGSTSTQPLNMKIESIKERI